MRTIDHAEASTLLEAGAATLLDVRTPAEYAELGHLPGAWLLPVDLIASAPAVLPRDGRPVLVYCEHGVRSAHASRFLDEAGVADVRNLAGGMAVWTGAREFGGGTLRGPAGWLLDNADLLAPQATRRGRAGERRRALDVACGRGRHALLLAAAGFAVTALDRDPEAVGDLQATAERLQLEVRAEVRDLETGERDLGDGDYDVVLVTNYLHRPLMPALVGAVGPEGLLIYETFTDGQAERGHPTNPAFLLKAGELPGLVAPLTVLRQREGEVDGKLVASVVAQRR
jgi:rhodanese-related sulfurtransferase